MTTTNTTWIDAEVLNLYAAPAISVRHSGPFGATALEITGAGVPALMGGTLTQLRELKNQSQSDDAPKGIKSRMAFTSEVTEKSNAVSAEWAKNHTVQYEQDADKNPTGRVRVDGQDIADVCAGYSQDEE